MTSKGPSTLTTEPNEQAAIGSQIEALTRKSGAHFEVLRLPAEALPKGLAVEQPHVGIKRDGDGDITIVDLAPHVAGLAGKPVRRRGTARATTLESFIGLVNRHGAVNTAVFADVNWKAPIFTAVIDYHAEARDPEGEETVQAVGDDPHARFGQHRIVYQFPLSEAWKVWIASNNKTMDQQEFAEFLEEHVHELASPTQAEVNDARDRFKTTVANPTELIELSRGLEVLVGARIKSRQNLASGEKQLVFETEHKSADGGEIIVPGLFVVNVAPFYAGNPVRIFGRLRYRPTPGGVVWFYELYRPDLAIDERVTADLGTVADKTGKPTYHGSPEA